MRKYLKVAILLFIFLSSILALYIRYIADFDPVKMAIQLKNENKRDQALDVIEFSRENKIGDQQKLKDLHDQYQYDTVEKTKDLFWHGAIKGNVFNMYSGIGCVAADVILFGDVRDLTQEGFNLLTGKDVDYVVAGLSAIGAGTTVVEVTGVGVAVDAGVSVVKTVVKYVTKVFKQIPDSILRTAIAGKNLGSTVYKKIWILFKETRFSIPNVTTILSKVKDAKYLDAAIDLTTKLKKGGVIFISKTGEEGLRTYEFFKKLKLGDFFISGFRRNPNGVLGITKFYSIIIRGSTRGSKIWWKQGFLIPGVIAISFGAILLGMLPWWVPLITGIASGGYIAWGIYNRISNRKQVPKRDDLEVKREGKQEFYSKAEEALKSQGYQFYDGDRDIPGKGRGHPSKPDYIATKGDSIIIGEIKSQKEGPKSSSWRQIQNSDSENLKSVRNEVKKREEKGEVPKEVGGHEIIIKGQIPDYVSKIGKTYDLSAGVSKDGTIKGGYTVPVNELNNVEQALKNCQKDNYQKIDTGNGSVTYIFAI